MRPLAPEVAERRSGSVPRLLPKQRCKSRIVLLAALFAASVVARLPAQAAIPGISFPNGFVGDGASFTFNHDSGTGNPTINGSEIELTDGGKFESRSVYFNSTVDVAAFQTQFDFQIINPIADGFTFCIQRTSDTETGQGNGGMLGYYKIPESIAIKFDIWDQAVPHAVSTTGLFTNGAVPVDFIPPSIDVQAASGIDFHSGHVMRVLLTYAGGILNEQITDLTTKAVFNTEYNIDIPATIGASSSSPYAYVGFTAGTGADTSTQDLLNWTFTSNSPTPQDILKYRADAGDSGQYLSETTLNATNVNFNTFGKLFSFTVDGAIYAQPLYKSSVAITAGTYKGTTHNVIFVATENDSVYAFDADDAEGTTPLWKTSFLNAAQGITTIPESDQPSGNIDPVGITSTPVIDPTTGTIFVCAKSKQIISGTSHWYLRMHALDISSGVEKAGSGLAIADTTTTTLHGPAVYGNGSGATGGRVGYAVLTQNQRSALNLLNGTVYIASSGNSGDVPPYHGWVIGCSAFTYKVTAAWNANPNGADAGIWEGGAGLISDSNGYLYVATGNGTFTQPTYNTTTDSYTGGDYGDTILLQNMTLSGTTTVYSGTGQNSITVDQPASITHGVLNLDGTGGIDSYTVDYTGSNNYLINVNGSPSTMTPVTLTSAGVGTIASAVPSVSFNASTAVNVSNSTLTVTTGSTLYKTGDVVRYDYGTSGSYTTIGGLNNDELYYVVVENNSSGTQTIKLAATLADALEGKTISFTSAGPDSTQYLQPVVASQTIASVSTTANTITFTSNLASFLNGERVVYSDVVGTVTGPAIGGLTSGDTYYVIVVNPTTIELSKSSLTDASTLTINGTSIAAESLLMRANSAGTLGFVADIDSGTNVERVNYTGAISDLIVNTGTGAGDSVTMDDNLTYTVVQGGGGNDSFQVGQVFQSQRDATSANNDDGVGMEDAFTTVSTSQGWLSNGVSYEATILGGTGSDTFTIYHNVGRLDLDGQGGNNTFVVRAFASDSSNTAIHTGNGNNTVEYIANADVSIDGGSGQNTLELIGTEFDDVFVITSTAIYGAGRTVDFTNIQNFIIDGLAGNDQFYILSTSATVTTTLYGGIGSSEFVIGGALPSGLNVDDGSGLPFTVPAGTTYGDLNAMKGTININGGPATAISTTLDNPVMMPGELNYAVIDGTVGAFTEGADGEDDSMTVETSSLVAAAQRLGFTGTTQQLLSDLQGYTVSISTGNAAGWFYQIEGLSLSANQTEVTLTLKEPTDTTQFAKSTPHAGNSFGITSLSSDFFVNENAQVNYLTVYDNKSVDPQNVTLTSDSLTVTDTTTNNTATINYYNTGVLELNLGDYGDTVNITSTMSRSTFDCVTMVNLDSGFTNTGTISNIVDNSVTVALTSSTDGLLAINLEEGHSTVDASASTTGMIIFGGEGDNTILGGLGNDIIFGGEGRVDYYDASGNLITRLGVDLNDQNVLTPSGTANSSSPIDDVPYWQTESSFGGTINVHSVDTNATSGLEGNNNITVGNGNDIIFGGDGSSNIIKVGNGNDVVFGDNGSVQISASGMVSLTSHSAPSGEIATNWSFTSLTMADKGANTGDKIAVGNGANYVFGGDESDTIQVGNGTNYVFGDNGTIDFSGVTVASAATTATDSTVGSNDTINVGNGTNYVFGGYESNAIKAGNGTNYIFGNNGTISFSNGVVVSAATSTTASSIGSDDEITLFKSVGASIEDLAAAQLVWRRVGD